jgi:hypothetical protein
MGGVFFTEEPENFFEGATVVVVVVALAAPEGATAPEELDA